ncbi:MAG: ferredoxin [Myxococcales bacterium]|nr:ferredoxin [Myxococcales bacterium]
MLSRFRQGLRETVKSALSERRVGASDPLRVVPSPAGAPTAPVPSPVVVAAVDPAPSPVRPADMAPATLPTLPKHAPGSLAAAAVAAARDAAKIVHADTGSTELGHYLARAKANGRDTSAITGGVGLNHADDGAPYWGPLDNESSRAKAAGKLLAIDQWECISCGTCVEQTERVFVLPADAKASPIAQDGPMDLIQDAIEACPVTCIHWVEKSEAAARGLATGTAQDA